MGWKCKYTVNIQSVLDNVGVILNTFFSCICQQVGSHFGYFPKDLLAVNHIYTDIEFEVPAEV